MSVRSCFVAAKVAAVVAGVACASSAGAGPLDPPAGPIAPTHKTLSEVEARIAVSATNTPGDADSHFKITQAGSYYLTGNITLPSSEKAIEIFIAGGQQVTLDLNGFTISASDAARTLPAIAIDGANAHVVIRNGTIRNWSNAVQHAIGGSIAIEDVRAYDSRFNQFELRDAVVTRCLAVEGESNGFFVTGVGRLSDCLARGNSADGFTIGDGSLITTGCVSLANGEDGFTLGQGIAEGCRAESNGRHGFINPGPISGCIALTNEADGIVCGTASTVRACTVTGNTGDGIRATSASHIEGNTVTSNGEHGVSVGGARCVVRGNLIASNARSAGVFAGVFCSSTDCTIDSNQISNMTLGGDDIGIQVTGASNLIVRNQLSGLSTAMTIGAGNTSGGTSANPATAGAWVNLTY